MAAQPPRSDTGGGRVEELAADFLERLSRGEAVDRDAFALRLPAAAERAEFRELLRFAVTVENCLPQVIEAGQRLGPYLLEEEIGRGGMGRVFRARDENLERTVAVKVTGLTHEPGALLVERFERESRLLAQLKHPGIVAVHDSGRVERIRYLVMDFVDGTSLERVIAELVKRGDRGLAAAIDRPVPAGGELLIEPGSYWRSSARIVARIAQAVEAAHAAGVLHRDLKPANVMLVGGGQPVVLDFGLAGSIEGAGGAVTQGFFGTPAYLAPEQIRAGRVGADVRTDAYQLGLILYELLALRRAFDGETAADVTHQIVEGELVWPRVHAPDVPPDLEAICLKAAARGLESRYATVRALREDLDRFLAGEPTVARPPGVLRRVALRVRRHRIAAALLATAVIGVSAGLLLPDSGRVASAATGRLMRLPQGSLEPQFVQDGELTHADELLVELVLPTASELFALHVSHDAQRRPTEVLPLPLTTERDLLDAKQRGEPAVGRFLCTLPAGRARVALAHVTKDDVPLDEAVWIYTSDRFPDWCRRWIGFLEAAAGGGSRSITYPAALDLLREANGATRGSRPVAARTPLEIDQLLEAMARPAGEAAPPWPFDDPLRRVFTYRVVR